MLNKDETQYLTDQCKGKTIQTISVFASTIEILFTDGNALAIHARGTEEQWLNWFLTQEV